MFFLTYCSHLKLGFLLGHFVVNFMLETIFGILSSFILKTLKICTCHLTLLFSMSSTTFITKFFFNWYIFLSITVDSPYLTFGYLIYFFVQHLLSSEYCITSINIHFTTVMFCKLGEKCEEEHLFMCLHGTVK